MVKYHNSAANYYIPQITTQGIWQTCLKWSAFERVFLFLFPMIQIYDTFYYIPAHTVHACILYMPSVPSEKEGSLVCFKCAKAA